MEQRTLYRYELRKLFCSKLNLFALAGATMMLMLLALSSANSQTVSRAAAEELDGKAIDARLLDEMKTAMRYENGSTEWDLTGSNEKYGAITGIIVTVEGKDRDLTLLPGSEFYALRSSRLEQRMKSQLLSEADRSFWAQQEAKVDKPFVYHYHEGPATMLRAFQALGIFIMLLSAVGLSGVYSRETADRMNQLLLCSRYGRKKLYGIKLMAGFTWILAAAFLLLLALFIPYCCIFGMDGMNEMLQLVKPMSMLPFTIGQTLAVYLGVYLLAAVLFASVTMFLSVTAQNTLAVTGGMIGYLLVDMFAGFPEKYQTAQKIWALRPNAVLMNTGFSNYRLIRLAGHVLLNYQAAPLLYAFITAAALILGGIRYRRLQVGKR